MLLRPVRIARESGGAGAGRETETETSQQRRQTDRKFLGGDRSRSSIGLALWLTAFSLYAVSGPGHSSFGDGYLLFVTARSLLDRGTLAIDPVPGAGNAPQRHGAGGRAYAIFAPGLAFAEIPMIALGRTMPSTLQPRASGESLDPLVRDEFWAVLTNAWVSATTVVIVYLCGMALGFSPRVSLANALLLAAASPLWCYARTDSTEALQSMLLAGATLVAFRCARRPSAAHSASVGVLLGLAIVAKLANAALVPWYVYYCARTAGRWREALRYSALLLASVCAALLLEGACNLARFGSAFDTGYRIAPHFLSEPLLSGIAILLFSPAVGLVFFYPMILLLPVGARTLMKTDPSVVVLVAGVFASVLALYATNWAYWQFAWGPRLLLPAIPLLSIFLLPMLSKRSPRLRTLIVVTAMLGTSVQLVVAGSSWWHQVSAVQRSVQYRTPREMYLDPRMAPLRIGAWWLDVILAEHVRGTAHAALVLKHPPWEAAFPWRPDASAQALWNLRGLDLWAAPSSWRMPYRPIGRTSAGLAPIPSSPTLAIVLATILVISAAALGHEARRLRAAADGCQSGKDVP
jgi:hypothetical protein